MKAHRKLTADALDRAALYSLNGMSEPDAARFEAHLDDCELCRREVDALQEVVGDLGLAAPEVEPPAGLRERVLAQARKAPFVLLPRATRRWLPSGTPGIELSQLWVDQTDERHTILIRMQPGARLPLHAHVRPEECFVVQGDLRDGSLRLEAGDYIRFQGGTRHTISSEQGCILFVTASLHDHLVEFPSAPD